MTFQNFTEYDDMGGAGLVQEIKNTRTYITRFTDCGDFQKPNVGDDLMITVWGEDENGCDIVLFSSPQVSWSDRDRWVAAALKEARQYAR